MEKRIFFHSSLKLLHKGLKWFGVLNDETGKVFCTEEETYDAIVFLELLHKVLAYYPVGKIVLILDNARIHHVKLLQPFLQANRSRLELVFLPAYRPPVEAHERFVEMVKRIGD
ncbi:transposase [Marinococcus halotolerans]|uniref:transposase n=1 Tax=Marinococcus halotolerans TaxID=301092 RepID=UPI0009FE9D7F|nr:transposase [Marinococcus halotolerans]